MCMSCNPIPCGEHPAGGDGTAVSQQSEERKVGDERQSSLP